MKKIILIKSNTIKFLMKQIECIERASSYQWYEYTEKRHKTKLIIYKSDEKKTEWSKQEKTQKKYSKNGFIVLLCGPGIHVSWCIWFGVESLSRIDKKAT